MNRSLIATATALLAAAVFVSPAMAQRAVQPAAAEAPINFEQYREFRIEIITRRLEQLALRLAEPGLPEADKTRLEAQKAYWERWSRLPAPERDRLFRERFDEIDTNHDGTIDAQERAAWRAHQQAYYRQFAADRGRAAEPR